MQPKILYLERVDSTNRYLRERAEELPDLTACYSLDQYAGSGRRGRTWHGKKGDMLALSLLLHHPMIQDMPVLPLLCVVCAVRVLKKMTNRDFMIKWPNDVVLEGKKICGILCESRILGERSFAVCGIGFNVLAQEAYFLEAGLPYAASVFSMTGLRLDPVEIAEKYVEEFSLSFAQYRQAGSFAPFVQEYRAASVNLGKQVRVLFDAEEVQGKCLDITPDGALLVEIDGIPREIRSGEASVRGLYGYTG